MSHRGGLRHPIARVEYAGDVGPAIQLHDATPYGLTGSIVSENYRALNRFRDRSEGGFAYANLACIGAEVQLPFGGVKRSGSGQPHAREVIETVIDRTSLTVKNAENIEMAQGLSVEITTE